MLSLVLNGPIKYTVKMFDRESEELSFGNLVASAHVQNHTVATFDW